MHSSRCMHSLVAIAPLLIARYEGKDSPGILNDAKVLSVITD